jgi:aspartate beta-hydroxylase
MNDPVTAAITHIKSLLDRGDAMSAQGKARATVAFYTEALRQAAQLENWPAGVAERLATARDTCNHFAKSYADFLQERLAAIGFDRGRSSRRFAESLDIVLGRAQPYVQQPRFYLFPGLPQIQFYERALFPWMDKVEQATDLIREEFAGLLETPELFAPYVQGEPDRPVERKSNLYNNPEWSACYIWKNGQPALPVAKRCPQTLNALIGAPMAYMPDRSPSILFSVLKPGARIPPHNGLINTRLICHLPLVVPGGCGFRVGNDVREWQVGKCWAFDDTIEHEAWNNSDRTRVILLFDIWRPELSEEERELVGGLFKAIDGFEGEKPQWEI